MFKHASIEKPPHLCIIIYVLMQEINKPRQTDMCEDIEL